MARKTDEQKRDEHMRGAARAEISIAAKALAVAIDSGDRGMAAKALANVRRAVEMVFGEEEASDAG